MEVQEPDLIVPCHVSCGMANVIDVSYTTLVSFEMFQAMTTISAWRGEIRMPEDNTGVPMRVSSLFWFSSF